VWSCGIPGKANTLWEHGVYPLQLLFPADYPSNPPKAQFSKLFHPNVYPSGNVCLSILAADKDWKPSITIKEVLLGVQDLLDNPNVDDPAQQEPYTMYVKNKSAYDAKILEQAKAHTP
jgi:ubiquitin-conjugating enzyme E2 I